MVLVSFWLTFLSMTIPRSTHTVANDTSFCLWLKSTLLYTHTSVHSSADDHLGCFHVLAIVTGLWWTQGCMYLFKTEYYMGICSGVGPLGHMATLFLKRFHSWSFFNAPFGSCFSQNPSWLLQSTWIPPWMNSQNVSTLRQAASTICMLTCDNSHYRAVSLFLPWVHAVFSNRPSTSWRHAPSYVSTPWMTHVLRNTYESPQDSRNSIKHQYT